MSDLLEQIKHTVDATIPDKDELVHEGHKKRDYIMLYCGMCLSVWRLYFLYCLSFLMMCITYSKVWHISAVQWHTLITTNTQV